MRSYPGTPDPSFGLDDDTSFAAIDQQQMISHIEGLPDQLKTAWDLGDRLERPARAGVRQVLVAGMGGSAIAADLLAAYVAPTSRVPVVVLRDYDLPAWATGADTLLIASSHSGNTEETLSAFQQALERGCSCLALTTGGNLESAANQAGAALWKFEHHGQPRSAVGLSFGLLLKIFSRLDFIPDPRAELDQAVQAMRNQQEHLRASIPAAQNPAKRLAGQMIGRVVTVFGSGLLAPVARRWKTQINELAKAWAQFEELPEADHNALAGVCQPENVLSSVMTLFLQSPADHPRNRMRSDLTRKVFMLEGLNTDVVHVRNWFQFASEMDLGGDSPLAQQWTCLHLGDYVAYYLAMAYRIDPTPVDALTSLKEEMKAAG